MSLDQKDIVRGASEDSMDVKSPSPEREASTSGENSGQRKRKGGRKPIYATSEERKQRNRQAQAAFRERRTEYIKHLEDAIRNHETNFHCLQATHRNTCDEFLLLKYKNSLLERILLEKGIDVQTELRSSAGNLDLTSSFGTPVLSQIPSAQRAITNRNYQTQRRMNRFNSKIANKLEPGAPYQLPRYKQTPHSPGFITHRLVTPPATDSSLNYRQQQFQSCQPQTPHALEKDISLMGANDIMGFPYSSKDQPRKSSHAHWANHMNIEQNYTVHSSTVDHPDSSKPQSSTYHEDTQSTHVQRYDHQQSVSSNQIQLEPQVQGFRPQSQNSDVQVSENAQSYNYIGQGIDQFDTLSGMNRYN
ncbi:Bgt-339 [Blumeria graminis f. sp. tritici]|uniref:BZIP domain-containing protein n=4 Tax=Blumeria graminis TaxID=34373 RepID=A0A656KJI7_BLUGR|nr:hypothetical protein BGT96224_339 [Blumeria graminis f. sp. tritici 96224]VCU41068.1 Bgt-339 [Blumeria graminis f. sp. tritici]